MKIAIVGTGNIAFHLAKGLENGGQTIVAISSRDLKKAKSFCENLYEAQPINHLDFSAFKVDLVFLAVTDTAISTSSSQLKAPKDCAVVHLSGSKSIDELKTQQPKGVFYPLFSFSKNSLINWSDVPVFLQSDNQATLAKMEAIAKAFKSKHQTVTAHEKRALHVAAVFAQNFGNHLLKIASDICGAENIPFQTLKPLVEQGIKKSFAKGPESSQTGPAMRKDQTTISDHLSFLEGNPELQKIYETLTQHIIQTYGEG